MVAIKQEGGIDDIVKKIKTLTALEFVARQDQEGILILEQEKTALLIYSFLLDHPEENFT